MIPFSILDLSPIVEGADAAQALRNTIDLARLADALGYHRYWVAEHHGGLSLAGPAVVRRAVDHGIVAGHTHRSARLPIGDGSVTQLEIPSLKDWPFAYSVAGVTDDGQLVNAVSRVPNEERRRQRGRMLSRAALPKMTTSCAGLKARMLSMCLSTQLAAASVTPSERFDLQWTTSVMK